MLKVSLSQTVPILGNMDFDLIFVVKYISAIPFNLITNLSGSDFFPGFARSHIQEFYLMHYSKLCVRNWKPS